MQQEVNINMRKAAWCLLRYMAFGVTMLGVCVIAITIVLSMDEASGPFEAGAMSLLSLIGIAALIMSPTALGLGLVLSVLTLFGYDGALDAVDGVIAKAVSWSIDPGRFWIGCVLFAGLLIIGMLGWK
jgi:hypothetical protein